MRRRLKRAAVALAALLAGGAAYIYLIPFPEELLDRRRVTPVRFLDREGRLLWEGLAPDGARGRWVALSEISPWLVRATIEAEDRRFRGHPGVDPLAVARAARDDAASGRIVSGASTITMQLVRLMRPRKRSWWGKLEEAVLALRLERRLSKDGILEEYLNRAPYGGNAVGVEAGARRTFGKRARDLNPSEAALLAGLPQSPVRLDPLRRPEAAFRRQRWILGQMGAVETPVAIAPLGGPCEAETFVDWVEFKDEGEVRTTLDLGLQQAVEGIVRQARGQLDRCGAGEAAVVVLDNASGEVRAFVGAAARRRSPGSTLKPFAYALAIEGGRSPASLFEDAPAHYETPTGDYAPRNYDGRYHGTVTLRQALANSLNVPAVAALREVGMERFVRLVRGAGMGGINPDPRNDGLGIVIGNARVSPVELAGAYAMLARGGRHQAPTGRPTVACEARPHRQQLVLSPVAAYLVADILSDDGARALSFGTGTDLAFEFRVAAKTGTSPDHRDNWVAGFTGGHTVVVWVGNADGRPLRGTSGVEGAGPIFQAVMARLEGPWLGRPEGIVEAEVCAETGLLPASGCDRRVRELFPGGRGPASACAPRAAEFRLETPQSWDRFYVDPTAPSSSRFLAFRAHAPAGMEVEWRVDGEVLGVTPGPHEVRWPARPGVHEVDVRSPAGRVVRCFQVR